MEEPKVTVVSPKEFERIQELIENPPEPTDELVEALKEH